MEKLSLAEKMAKKSFESGTIQKSWQVHIQTFGPILEPAFVGSYQARIHLTAALNLISNHDLKGGLEKLKGLQKYVETDADKAAWLFFMGLVFEMAGVKEGMLDFYQQSAQFGHKFYMPYLKVAKSAHGDAAFEAAEENYRAALKCLSEAGAGNQTDAVTASVYTNLASCLTMMHRYDEALDVLDASRQVLTQQPGRSATQAILYAAMGNADAAQELLAVLEKEASPMLNATREMVEKILVGQHPHFSPVAIDETKITAFWDWFRANETWLTERLAAEQYDALFPPMQEQLAQVFPFMERPLELAFQPLDEGGYTITFADFYMAALTEGYAKLLNARPDTLQQYRQFKIVH